MVTKFLQFVELMWMARDRAAPVNLIASKSATSAVWLSIFERRTAFARQARS